MAKEATAHKLLQLALETTPRNEWASSHRVSLALIQCPRIKSIIRQHILKRKLDMNLLDEIQQDVALEMQLQQLARLDEPAHAYFLIWRVIELKCSNYSRHRGATLATRREINFSDLVAATSGTEEEGEDIPERMSEITGRDETSHHEDQTIQAIDRELIRKQFQKKLQTLGWPQSIAREYKRVGRPRKETAATVETGISTVTQVNEIE